MEKQFKKVLAIDGSYLLHRQLHINEIFELKNNNGDRTGGVFGFLRSLNNELKTCGDYFPIVCLDNGLSPRRTKADPCYKHNDIRTDNSKKVLTVEEHKDDYIEQYRIQRNMIYELLSYFGIPCLKFRDWEGDDLLYILSKISEESMILTDDRDMLQLLTPDCVVRRPMAKELINYNDFIESNNYDHIDDFIIAKAVLGDGSDNIPGSCKGVGKANINSLIKLLKSTIMMSESYPKEMDEMKELCTDLDIKYRKAFLNFDIDRFRINMELVDLNRVEVTESILDSIVSTINNCKSNIDYFKAVSYLSNLEIKEFSVDNLIALVSNKYSSLMVD